MKREYIKDCLGGLGESASPWLAESAPTWPALAGDSTFDALVIGGGITGALVAREFAERGLHVALLERRRIACGATGHSTAKITVAHGTRWSERYLRRRAETRALGDWAGLNAAAPSDFEGIVKDLGLACQFRRLDAFLVASSQRAKYRLGKELRCLQGLGVRAEDLGRVHESPLRALGTVRIADQAQFDPAAFTGGLVQALPDNLVNVFEGSPVRRLSRRAGLWCAHTDVAVARAPIAVMTALAPVRDSTMLFTRLFPHTAYVLEVVAEAEIPDGLWIGAGSNALTLRPGSGSEPSWIVSGQRMRQASRSDETRIYERLRADVTAQLGRSRVLGHWSTQDFSTPDRLPVVGRVGPIDGLYIAGGFGGWGMSASLASARLVGQAIAGSADEGLLRLLAPDRLPSMRGLPTFISENAIVARRFLRPLVAPAGGCTAPGPSADTADARPPRCTHLRCRLKHNTAEGTLDCPCHGSRFSDTGEVLYGPARREMRPRRAAEAAEPLPRRNETDG